MALFDDKNTQDAFLDSALRKYYKYKTYEWMGDQMLDNIVPNEARDLSREQQKLDIMLKKKALGISTRDADGTFVTQLLPSLSRKALSSISGPDIYGTPPKAMFKIATSVGEALPSLKTTTKALGGNKYAQLFKAAALL